MDDNEATKLINRVEELERSNKALWAWVKALANQDSMILEFAFRLEDHDQESALQNKKIIKHISDNAHSIHGIPLHDFNE